MNISNVYNFFFHPLNDNHTTLTKTLSLITITTLSILTLSGFLLIFAGVNLKERLFTPISPNTKITRAIAQTLPTKASRIKIKQKEQLKIFEDFAKNSDWKRFKPEYSHYDWWMFPIQRASSGYGETYAVSEKEVHALKNDPEFMKNYRRGVELVLTSWGWDVQNHCEIPKNKRTNGQEWSGYGVRLGKMADSLLLFEEFELYQEAQNFFHTTCLKPESPQLEKWVINTLSK